MNTLPSGMATQSRNPSCIPEAISYIRFSTPDQLQGDSLRRQIAMSREYARRHGLRLNEQLTLRDLGVSAFRGKNSRAGALAAFLTAVNGGKVTNGSYLLLESLDRLSRAQITEALPVFLQIINGGITVVTLADEMVYSKATLDQNIGNLMMSLVIMSRAHEESATKSVRLAQAWEAKRTGATTTKLTAQAPAWLELAPDRSRFRQLPDRVRIVRRIFSLSQRGYGKRRIAQQLNEEHIEPWGRGRRRGNGWHDSYIQKILSNRAVVGEFQPHRLVNGRRSPVGEPIANYFPAIVDPELFARVARQPPKPPGRAATAVSNLFSGLAYDGYSGAKMRFVNKGTAKRGAGRWKYLVTDSRRMTRSAASCAWNYPHFEKVFLNYVGQLDWHVIADEGGNDRCEELKSQLAAAEAEKERAVAASQRVLHAIETSGSAPEILINRLQTLEHQVQQLTGRIAQLRHQFDCRLSALQEFQGSREIFSTVAAKIDEPDIRRRVAEEIRRKIARVDLFPRGVRKQWNSKEARVKIDSERPVFAITFRNGITRWVMCYGNVTNALTLNCVRFAGKNRWVFDRTADGRYSWSADQPAPSALRGLTDPDIPYARLGTTANVDS